MPPSGERSYPIRTIPAPLTARGYIIFVNLRPDKKVPGCWCCDQCGDRVVPSKFEAHAKREHGWKSGRDPY